MINKDQRTVWTVCKRAEKKSENGSEKISGNNPEKYEKIDDGRKTR
jgi:hypothetical protein